MTASRGKFRRFVADERGAAAVEFAVVSVAFFMFLFAIAYIAIIMFTNATLQWAVESGSRLAAINQAATQSDISNAVNSYLAAANAPSATVNYSVSQNGTLKTAIISASFSESYSVPLISTFDIDYNASTSVPLAN
jgi:Flp pilus assembly protein TadG